METQPDLYGGPDVSAEKTPPMRHVEAAIPWAPPVRAIMLRACAATGVSIAELTGPSRVHRIARIRKAIYLAAWNEEERSSRIVAEAMNREGSTVRQMADEARRLVKVDPEFAALVIKVRG
jgi:hypothetical protein